MTRRRLSTGTRRLRRLGRFLATEYPDSDPRKVLTAMTQAERRTLLERLAKEHE